MSAAIRCAAAAASRALFRRVAAGGQRGALRQIFSSPRPRGIHSLPGRRLPGAGALSSPTSSMGRPTRSVVPSNRHMSTSSFQKGNGVRKDPSAKVPWHERFWPRYNDDPGIMMWLLPPTIGLLYEVWDYYDKCELETLPSVAEIAQLPNRQ